MGIVLTILAVLFLLYVFMLRGRTGHKDLPALRNWAYAHRGLHEKGIPENSMAAFRNAVAAGYGAELDVRLLADGELAVLHDSSLKRMTGADGAVEDLTAKDLQNYFLAGTDQCIPLLRDVLELFAGKAPLIVELKSERNNYAALCNAACDLLDRYNITYCVESFDPRCIRWLKQNRPDVIRGQLSKNFMESPQITVPAGLKFIMTHQLVNFLICPDFVAYKFKDRKNPGNLLVRKLWGVQGVAWTLKTKADFDTAVKEGWIPIFEEIRP